MRVLLSLMLMNAAAHAADLTAAVRDEADFEGAVRVTSRWAEGERGYVTVTIPYRDIRGHTRQGHGRLYFTRDLVSPRTRSPVYCAAYYEISQEDARKYCDLGFVVATPHEGENARDLPFGDGYNLMKALIQWVRRLPCIDRTRLQIGGDSAGAYMTLAMGAEFFPVSALTPNMPAVNWAYGCNYLLVNQQPAGCLLPPGAERPLPILALTAPGANAAMELFGSDLSAATWHTLSPISYVERITAPTLVVCATGDLLCTIEHFTARRFFTLTSGQFPENYQRDFDTLTLCPQARRRLDECIPADQLSVRVMPRPEGLHEFTREDAKHIEDQTRGLPQPPELDLPWSKDKQWSLVILDEGAPLPHSGHRRYYWNTSFRSFMAYHRDRTPSVGQLNAAKLRRLMERYAGRLTDVATLADGTTANRLNFELLERLDVLAGLLDYARLGPRHAKRLEDLYRTCSVRPFGDKLRVPALQDLEERLRGRIKP